MNERTDGKVKKHMQYIYKYSVQIEYINITIYTDVYNGTFISPPKLVDSFSTVLVRTIRRVKKEGNISATVEDITKAAEISHVTA